MRREDRECIVFEKTSLVGFTQKRGNYVMLARVVALISVVALAVALIFGRAEGKKKINDEGSSGDRWLSSEKSTESEESDLTDSATESQSREEENDSATEESEGNLGNDVGSLDEIVSMDLSRSEMGDCFTFNYSDIPLDLEGLMAMSFSGSKYSFSEKPLVLIVHTYSKHGYYDFDVGDPMSVAERGVVAVGALLAERLNSVGISTVHVTVAHDENGSDPHEEAQKTIKTMLEIYPSVECVIDLGRFDAKDDDGRLVRAISTEGGAQVRLTVSTNGLRWKDDLSLALKLRKKLNREGAGGCLPIVVSESPYNSGISLYYLKVDVGTEGNSSHEAFYAIECFADALEEILKK